MVAPIIEWTPVDPQPDLGSPSYKLQARWNRHLLPPTPAKPLRDQKGRKLKDSVWRYFRVRASSIKMKHIVLVLFHEY